MTTPQVDQWKANEHFQNFMRQVHVDIHVAIKNKVPPAECRAALQELCVAITNSVDWRMLRSDTSDD